MDITNTLIIFRDTFIPYNIFYEICFAKISSQIVLS